MGTLGTTRPSSGFGTTGASAASFKPSFSSVNDLNARATTNNYGTGAGFGTLGSGTVGTSSASALPPAYPTTLKYTGSSVAPAPAHIPNSSIGASMTSKMYNFEESKDSFLR